MSSDTAQQVKDKIDVVDFIRQYLEVKQAGKNFKACCPFHKEKTPSFMISPERQSWHCFGCAQGGDVIKFLMLYENIEFYDALKILAEKAGIDLRQFSNRDFKSYNNLYVLMEEAKNFYHSGLFQSRKVLDYAKERGLKEETVREFELGLAPDSSDVLTRHLLKKGFKVEDIEKAGLTLKTERGTYWDRFRSRLMFPIYNHVGKVVAFTGRLLPWNDPSTSSTSSPQASSGQVNSTGSGYVPAKYVNSPETPIFLKSKILYGFHKTKNDIRTLKSAVAVEGQIDFLMIWQDGVKNAIATSGTALTADHLAVLRRLADEIVLSFDSDSAGQAAAERAIDMANANDFVVKLLVIEDHGLKDPADVAKAKPGAIIEMLKNARTAMDYYFHKYIQDMPNDQKARKSNIRIVLAKIKGFKSAIDRSHWLKHLSNLVDINESSLIEEMNSLPAVNQPKEKALLEEAAEPENLSRRDLIIQRLFGIFLYKNNLKELGNFTEYFPERYVEIYKDIANEKEMSDNIKELVAMINLRFSFENQNLDDERLTKELKMLEKELKIEHLKDKLQEIGATIKELEKSGDKEKLEAAVKEFAVISKELYNTKD